IANIGFHLQCGKTVEGGPRRVAQLQSPLAVERSHPDVDNIRREIHTPCCREVFARQQRDPSRWTLWITQGPIQQGPLKWLSSQRNRSKRAFSGSRSSSR